MCEDGSVIFTDKHCIRRVALYNGPTVITPQAKEGLVRLELSTVAGKPKRDGAAYLEMLTS